VLDVQINSASGAGEITGLVLSGGNSTLVGVAITNFGEGGVFIEGKGGDVISPFSKPLKVRAG
jgi:hypothetical protein